MIDDDTDDYEPMPDDVLNGEAWGEDLFDPAGRVDQDGVLGDSLLAKKPGGSQDKAAKTG